MEPGIGSEVVGLENESNPGRSTTFVSPAGDLWMEPGIASEVVGLRTKAIGSLDDLVSPAGDLWMEPVISSSAGACFAPLPTFRSATIPNTRIAAATMLSRVLRRFCIDRSPNSR